MDRMVFTEKIVALITLMIQEGENPVIDFVKRTAEEQKRLFNMGLSKCDGIKNVSKHQIGRAMDILFFTDEGQLGGPKRGYEFWHKRWEEMDGKPIITWDAGHFEG